MYWKPIQIPISSGWVWTASTTRLSSLINCAHSDKLKEHSRVCGSQQATPTTQISRLSLAIYAAGVGGVQRAARVLDTAVVVGGAHFSHGFDVQLTARTRFIGNATRQRIFGYASGISAEVVDNPFTALRTGV